MNAKAIELGKETILYLEATAKEKVVTKKVGKEVDAYNLLHQKKYGTLAPRRRRRGAS